MSVSGNLLTFVAAPGETNDVRLEVWNQGSPGEFIAVFDRGAVLTAGSGCTPIGPDGLPVPPAGAQRANCGAVSAATVTLGDMNDSAWMGTRRSAQDPQVQVTLSGGEGNDFLLGGPLADQVVGGAGNDRIDGWEGADTLAGEGGDDTFEMAECSESPCLPTVGDDTVSGGDGIDTSTYVRDTGVAVTMDGVDDDGGAGERDNIGTDVENLVGGRQADVLTGNANGNDIDGGGEDSGGSGDTLNGLGGDDTVHANNASRSTVNGNGGDDLLYSARVLNGGDGNDRLDRFGLGLRSRRR